MSTMKEIAEQARARQKEYYRLMRAELRAEMTTRAIIDGLKKKANQEDRKQ